MTGRSFFPGLISGPFTPGLDEVFDFAIVACLVAAAPSWMRGGRYVHGAEPHVIPAEALEGEVAPPAEGD